MALFDIDRTVNEIDIHDGMNALNCFHSDISKAKTCECVQIHWPMSFSLVQHIKIPGVINTHLSTDPLLHKIFFNKAVDFMHMPFIFYCN